MTAPLFVFGIARSGTNLLARMLDAHPRISLALDPLMPLFKVWRNLTVEHAAPAYVADAFDPASPFQDYYFSAAGPVLLDLMLATSSDLQVPPREQDALRAAVHERAALESSDLAMRFSDWHGETVHDLFRAAFAILRDHAAGKANPAFVGIKEVWTLEFALPLARAFPQARFLVIHRDPRAVIASLATMMRDDGSQAAHTISYLRHWRKHVAVARHLETAPDLKDRLMAVRFEDLVAEPGEQGKRLATFLDLDFEEVMLRPGQGIWGGNSSFGPLRAAIDANACERWRDHLGCAMIETVEYYCGPEMGLLGYPAASSETAPGRAVVRETFSADRRPGKWRSDSGDPAADLAWEMLRRTMLAGAGANWPEEVGRRCFLFDDIFAALCRQNCRD